MTVITPQYIDPPKAGKKQWSIKDTNNERYGAFQDIASQMKVGGTYEITYETRQFNGANYKTIKTAVMKSPPPAGGQTGGGTYRETSQKDAERMWVTAVVRAGIQAGVIALDAQNLTHAVKEARSAWNQTFGSNTQAAPATKSQQLDDEIPY